MRENASGGLMLLVLVYLMAQLSGCTFIGATIDAHSNKQTSSFIIVSGPDIASVSPGKKMIVSLRSGDSVEGTFLKPYPLSRDEYTLVYPKDEKLGSGALRLPRLGESLILTEASGRTSEWEFNGFDLRETISLRRPASYQAVKMPLDDLKGLQDAPGEFYDLSFIRTSVRNGLVPFLTTFWFYGENGKFIVPSDQVLAIRMEKSKHGALTGTIIGIVLDVAVIALFSSIHYGDYGKMFGK